MTTETTSNSSGLLTPARRRFMDRFVLAAAILTVVVGTGAFLIEGDLGWGVAALWALQCAVLKIVSDE